MATMTQPKNLGDLVRYDVPIYSREMVTIASGQLLDIGTVLGKNLSDGKYYALNLSANDGTEVAVAVLAQAVDAASADVSALAILRHAVLAKTALVWPSGITTTQMKDAEKQLKQAGILVRDSV